MNDGYAQRLQSADRAACTLTPTRRRSLPSLVSARDSQGWRGPRQSDPESEHAAVRATMRSSLVPELLASPPPSHEWLTRGKAALMTGSQTLPAILASNA